MGKEGVYLEDHEDQLSIQGDGEDISYNQAHYSPKKYKDTGSRYDRRTAAAHSDEVYQNGSYLGKHYAAFAYLTLKKTGKNMTKTLQMYKDGAIC